MITLLGVALIASACGRSGTTLPSSTTTAVATTPETTTSAPSTTATPTTSAPTTSALTTSAPAAVACPPVSSGAAGESGALGSVVAVFDTATGAFVWDVPAGGSTSATTAGDVVVVGDETAVRAYNGVDGSLRWCRVPGGSVSASTDTVAILTPSGTLLGVDAGTGQDKWSQQVNAPQDPALVFGDISPLRGGAANIYFDTSMATGGMGPLVAFDAVSGASRWSWQPPGCADQSGCVGGPWTPVEGPLVYVADPNDGRLLALDPATGVEQWSFAVGAQAGPWGVSADDGTVAFTANASSDLQSMDQELFAVDARSGERRWVVPASTTGLPPTVASDLVVTISQSDIGSEPPADGTVSPVSTRIDALAAATGTPAWSHELQGEAVTSMTPVADVLITPSFARPSMEPGFIALDARTGAERWRSGHTPAFRPDGSSSTSGYEAPLSLAGGDRFASVIHFGTAGD